MDRRLQTASLQKTNKKKDQKKGRAARRAIRVKKLFNGNTAASQANFIGRQTQVKQTPMTAGEISAKKQQQMYDAAERNAENANTELYHRQIDSIVASTKLSFDLEEATKSRAEAVRNATNAELVAGAEELTNALNDIAAKKSAAEQKQFEELTAALTEAAEELADLQRKLAEAQEAGDKAAEEKMKKELEEAKRKAEEAQKKLAEMDKEAARLLAEAVRKAEEALQRRLEYERKIAEATKEAFLDFGAGLNRLKEVILAQHPVLANSPQRYWYYCLRVPNHCQPNGVGYYTPCKTDYDIIDIETLRPTKGCKTSYCHENGAFKIDLGSPDKNGVRLPIPGTLGWVAFFIQEPYPAAVIKHIIDKPGATVGGSFWDRAEFDSQMTKLVVRPGYDAPYDPSTNTIGLLNFICPDGDLGNYKIKIFSKVPVIGSPITYRQNFLDEVQAAANTFKSPVIDIATTTQKIDELGTQIDDLLNFKVPIETSNNDLKTTKTDVKFNALKKVIDGLNSNINPIKPACQTMRAYIIELEKADPTNPKLKAAKILADDILKKIEELTDKYGKTIVPDFRREAAVRTYKAAPLDIIIKEVENFLKLMEDAKAIHTNINIK